MGTLPCVTISRQYGSGGRYIGQKLSEQLGIPLYDNELIRLSAEKSGYDSSLFEKSEDTASNSLMFTLSVHTTLLGSEAMSLGDHVFKIQSGIVRDLAQKEPCIIVGRCGDYVLRNHPNCVRIFIHAPLEWRIQNAVAHYGLDPQTAKHEIKRIDKKRASYYQYYTSQQWGQVSNYDITIDASCADVAGTVDVLRTLIERKA